tara:strand:+ start:65047 stop:65475 length:429 start_codon:yes stop_codon:yes gene_type:complete
MITPKPNDYVKISSQEEYDIAVSSFEKAGFYKSSECLYFDAMTLDSESVIIIDPDEHDFYSDRKEAAISRESNQLTIPQLREYLNESVYEVGDVVYVMRELVFVHSIDADNGGIWESLNDDEDFMFHSSSDITAHYKLQERK